MVKILVFGGRDYWDRHRLVIALDGLLAEHGDDLIIMHGGCRTGADKMADDWALDREVDCLRVAAKWTKFGKPAGPIRNRRMGEKYKPDWAIEFPGGTGTAGMRDVCAELGIKIAKYA